MEFRLLGGLQVLDDAGQPLEVRGVQPRALLAALLLAEGRVLSADALVEVLWGEAAPPSATGTLHSYVSRLRRVLEPARAAGAGAQVLRSQAPGYRLAVPPDSVDAARFRALADTGRLLLQQGDAAAAREQLLAAEALWRGEALEEFAGQEWAQAAAVGLAERRVAGLEDRVEAELRLGLAAQVAAELPARLAEHPLRERLHGQLALALYRCGRQADSLAAVDALRRRLRDELGLDLSRPLRELEQAVLRQDPSLDAPPPAPSVPAQPGPVDEPPPPGRLRPRADRLVGRDPELHRLRTVLEEAVSGATCFALVEGEPGIGKTRLLEEVALHAAAQGVRVVWGRCPESEQAPALWPWLEVTRALLDDVPDEERGAVVGPELAALLAPADGPTPPGDQRFRLYDAVSRTLEQLSARRPVLIVLEDLHWADAASAHLLGALTERLYTAPLAVVSSLRELELGRDDPVVAAVAAVTRRSGGSRLRLRGLAEAESRALVEQAVGGPVADGVASALHARADGNPFYATELARLLAAEGGLDSGAPDAAAALPSGVRDVVRRRLSGLGEATSKVLALAAVLGREIDLAVLVAAEGGNADDCLDALEPALASRTVLAVPDAPAHYRFAHALVREVVLDGLTPLRRARLHARAADAVQAVHGDTDDTCEQVASHLWSATALGGARRAAEQLERAAEVAVRRCAYESADDLLERAAGLRRDYGGDCEEDEAELVTLVRLAALRRMTTGLPTGHLVVPQDRCKELAYRTGRFDLYAGLLWAEWAAAVTATRFERGGELLGQVQALCRDAGPSLEAMSHHCTGVHLWHLGRLQEAADELEAAHALMGEPPEDGTPTVLNSWFEAAPLGWSFYTFIGELSGRVRGGRERYARQLRWAGDDPYHQLVTSSMEAGILVCAGDWARAAEVGLRALAMVEHVPSDFFAGSASVYVGWGVAHRGEPARGLELVERGAELFRGTGARTCQGLVLSPRADVLRLLGRPEEALAAARHAEDEVVASGEPWSRPLAVLAAARALAALGVPPPEVGAELARAAGLARATGARLLEHRAGAIAAELGVPAPAGGLTTR